MGTTQPTAAATASKASQHYRPYSLRPQHLLFISSIALLLFGFLEVGLQTLPHASPVSFQAQQAAQSSVIQKRWIARQLAVGGIVAPFASTSLLSQVDTVTAPASSLDPTTPVVQSVAISVSPSVPLVGAAPPANYVAISKVTTISPVINIIQPLAITTPTTVPIVDPAVVTSPIIATPVVVTPIAVTPTATPSVPLVGAAPPAAYVDTQRVSTVSSPPTTTSPLAANIDNGSAVSQPAGVVSPVVQPIGQGTPASSNGGSAVNSQLLIPGTQPGQTTPSGQSFTIGTGVRTGAPMSLGAQIDMTASGSASYQVQQTVISGSSGLQTILTSVLVKPTAIRTGVQTTATISPDINQLTTSQKTGDGEVITMTWPLWKVFVGGYLPLLVAVIYRVLWADVYANVKMIEPFSQLARPEGAAIADVAHLYYLSTSLIPEQLISLAKGHWMMFLTSATYISVAGLSPLASEVLFLDTHYDCPHPDLNSPSNPCWPPQLSINPVIARLAQAVLCIVAALTIGLVWFLRCRQPRLHFDPSTIAGVASMMRHPNIAQDLRNFDSTATLEDLRDGLATRVYTIAEYQDETSTWRSELVPLQDRQYKRVTAERRPVHSISAWCLLHIDLLLDLWLLCFLTAAIIVVTIYLNIQDTSGFNKFFNSNTFGPRFIMSSVGTIIALNFRRLEREAHTLAPYRTLFQGPASANTTIDLKRPKSPFLAFHYMLLKRHYVPGVIAFAAMLAEALIIALAGVPYSPGQVFTELMVCGYLSVTILCIMIIAIVALLWWRRDVPALPHVPDTLISAMCYAVDLGTEGNDYEVRGEKDVLKQSDADDRHGRKFSFAKIRDERGFERWAIRKVP